MAPSGLAGRGRPPQAAARRAGLEDVEKLLTAVIASPRTRAERSIDVTATDRRCRSGEKHGQFVMCRSQAPQARGSTERAGRACSALVRLLRRFVGRSVAIV
jgi:hypothetical protein